MKNKPNSKTTIEIGIPAYNEEANIERLLRSIFDQNQDIYNINSVILISDGSSDHTIERAKKVKNKKLKIIEHSDQAGKPTRTNEIFRRARSDILILIDADVLLNSRDTISSLLRPLIDGKATLVSGRPEKTKTHRFTDHVMDVSLYLQDQIKARLNHGCSVYACHGRIIGLHRDVFSTLEVPTSALGDDSYLYFYNKQHGSGFAYAPNATVLFKMPQSLKDFINQQHRFSSTPVEQSKVFGEESLLEYKIPKTLSVRIMLAACLKYHLFAIAYLYYRIASKLAWFFESKASWKVSETTKEL